MGIFSYTPPAIAVWPAMAAAALVLWHNLRRAPWRSLDTHGAFSAWCASVILLPLAWHFAVSLPNGPALHLLGMPLFVLMFGRRLAMAGIALSVLAYTGMNPQLWQNLGVNLLLLAILPAYCGEAVMRAVERFLPHHLFVYLLGNGFFGAMLMLVLVGMLSLGVQRLWLVPSAMQGDFLAFMLLLSWGEAFLTGFLLTIFTIYRPQWVLTFDDDLYLKDK